MFPVVTSASTRSQKSLRQRLLFPSQKFVWFSSVVFVVYDVSLLPLKLRVITWSAAWSPPVCPATVEAKIVLPWRRCCRAMTSRTRTRSTVCATHLYWSTWTMTWVPLTHILQINVGCNGEHVNSNQVFFCCARHNTTVSPMFKIYQNILGGCDI